MPQLIRCKTKIAKITNLLVSTVAWNSGNCNLIVCVGFYDYVVYIKCNYKQFNFLKLYICTKKQNKYIFISKVSKPSLCI